MRKTLFAIAALASAFVATPAFATITVQDCPASYSTDPAFVDCALIDKNSLGGSADKVAEINAGFDAVGYVGPDFTQAILDSKTFFTITGGDILNFETALTGVNFIAVHFGSAGGDAGANNDTLFYQFDFGDASVSSVDLSRAGFSAAIGSFTVAQPVPEPATWAMMLLGFGAVGFSLRKQHRKLLPQAA